MRLLTFSAQILFKSLVSQKPKRNVENGRSKPIHLSTLPVAALVLLQRCVCVRNLQANIRLRGIEIFLGS